LVTKRAAFSLIELILTILIMSIAVVSLPSLLATVSSQSDELAISEESIMIVKTKISNILGALWDENSKKDSLVGIINAKNGNTQLKAAFRNLDINSSSYRVAKFADSTTVLPIEVHSFTGSPPFEKVSNCFVNPVALREAALAA